MFKSLKKLFVNNKQQTVKVRDLTRYKDILKPLFDLPVHNSWLDDETIDKIMRDSTVIAAIGNRKASTLKKEILIECENSNFKEILEDAFSFNVIDSILDIPYYGFGVYEINWEFENGFFIPTLVERNYKNFILDNGKIKFNSLGFSEDIEFHKVIAATYKAKPNKPYGQPLIQTLFWLVEFKNASLQFWIELLERFGTPWVIGKTEGDKNALAEEIYNMLGGDGAVIDTEDEIKIETAKDGGNFKELVEYIDNQIREVILGGNLTANVQGGSLAAANVHNEVREDLAQADENIVNQIIRELIWIFQEFNKTTTVIKGKLKDKDDPNKELADRDKLIYDMGYKPTKEYIETTYNIKVTEIEQKNNSLIANNNISRANPIILNNLPQDELERNLNNIDFSHLALTFQKQILEIINKSESHEEMLEQLFKAYPTFDTKELEDSLYKYLANASLLGVASIEDENPNG
ncbi:phage portal protein family protein [Aliarcobacter butzleri]|uniref:phage portal protein family protein n=1 Tax=Aliarcobacter butzleri TaxID=28197 RepID=UPI003AF82E26